MLQLTETEWQAKKDAERENDIHPCDNWSIKECMCKGACSCHWAQPAQDHLQTISTLKELNQAFYYLCFAAGVGSTAHAFIEFNGLMTAYIQILENAVRHGIDPHSVNEHSGVALPVEGHEIRYLAEKLRCLFGPVIDTNPEARAILLKELFGLELKG